MISRRALVAAIAALPLAAAAQANDLVDLDWSDLIPGDGSGTPLEAITGVVQHQDFATGFSQPEATGITEAYNGQRVRIPGFVIPLDVEAKGVTEFILVPYMGACIHVPPPPANQIIFVTTEEPYEPTGLFDPVYISGEFSASVKMTELAGVGYEIAADAIVPYEE